MPALNKFSESEQMYLVTIALLGESPGEFPVHISRLAETLQITSISANQMVHHLKKLGLVDYIPYKGVNLTDPGRQAAYKILRARRLWEVFLVEHLHYDAAEAEVIACDLEHAIPPDTAERLEAYLERPQTSPQGKPIPPTGDHTDFQPGVRLSNMTAGRQGVVIKILAGETEQNFLREAGLWIGTQIEVLGIQKETALLLKTKDDTIINLSAELSQAILVNPN